MRRFKRDENGEVELLTSAEFKTAVRKTVSSTGLTVDQLRADGRAGKLKTHRQRVAFDILRSADRLER